MQKYAEVIPRTVNFSCIPDKYPMYPGGHDSVLAYIGENSTYPAGPRERKVEGKITVEYTINVDGSISDLYVIRGIDKELDDEIVRVLQSMKGWIPAYQNGEPIKFRLAQSVYYKL